MRQQNHLLMNLTRHVMHKLSLRKRCIIYKECTSQNIFQQVTQEHLIFTSTNEKR